MRLISLTIALFLFWLALSGHYTAMLMTAGAVSAILCVLVAVRMGVADAEGHPIHLIGRFVTYFPWILREIAKSAWAVTKIIVHPKLPISPTMTVVTASQRTSAGIATYANSITLTPGTVSLDLDGREIVVHALTEALADEAAIADMGARVARTEGARKEGAAQ